MQFTIIYLSLIHILSEEGIDAMSWSEFVSSIEEPELIQYLKERRLYVNEYVMESEEM